MKKKPSLKSIDQRIWDQLQKDFKDLSRRDFLKLSGQLSSAYAGSALFTSTLVPTQANASRGYDCIIMGAGMAGASAARSLAEAGKKVLILEGNSRLGGRIYSRRDFSDRMAIELGAELIHVSPDGQYFDESTEKFTNDQTPLWDDILFRLKISKRDKEWQQYPRFANTRIYHSAYGGVKKPKEGFLGMAGVGSDVGLHFALNVLNGIHKKIEKYAKKPISEAPDLNAAQYVEFIMNKWAEDHGDHGEREQIRKDFLTMAIVGHVPQQQKNISIRGLGHDRSNDIVKKQKNDFFFHSGLLTVVEQLVQHPNIVVQKNSFVSEVHWKNQPNDGVKIVLDSGKTFSAPSAICTFSIGMMQSEDVGFFPKLPQQKRDSINKLTPGLSEKMVMKFNETFWDEEEKTKNQTTIIGNPDASRRTGRAYFNLQFGEKNKKGESLLTALVKSEDLMKYKDVSDDQYLKDICADLDDMFPNKKNKAYDLLAKRGGAPIKGDTYIRHSWPQEKCAKGCSSVMKFTDPNFDNARVREEIAAPNTGSLFWAGEHTALPKIEGDLGDSTRGVHGAHMSGKRAAAQAYSKLATGETISLPEWKDRWRAWTKYTVAFEDGSISGLQAPNWEELL